MAAKKPKPGLIAQVRAAKRADWIKQRFESDRQRVRELTDGTTDLDDLVEFVHSPRFRVGAPGWACCGTTGINGQPSFFGVTPAMIPGHCGTIKEMITACSSVAEVAGGSTRIMLHLGLHANLGKKKGTDEIKFKHLEPWLEWESLCRASKVDTLLSFDYTFWGGPRPDGLTLGSPCKEQRDHFIRHAQSGLVAMLNFAYKRPENEKKMNLPLASNVWLSDASKRLPADGLRLKQLIVEALQQVFDTHTWQGIVDFSQEGKAPPTQNASWMGVNNYDALLLAMHFGQRWCLDDGHGYPTEPLGANLESAKAHGIPIAAHITYSPSGSDDDLTLGTTGHPREFLLAASKLHSFSRLCTPDNSNYSDNFLLRNRMAALSDIAVGCDTFETGVPPEMAMVQDIQAVRMMAIASLLAPVNIELAALRSNDPAGRALAISAGSIIAQTVDLPNCLANWRLLHGLDPDWVGQVCDRFKKRVNK